MSVQLDFYHLYINAVHEDEEAINNATEAKGVSTFFNKVGLPSSHYTIH